MISSGAYQQLFCCVGRRMLVLKVELTMKTNSSTMLVVYLMHPGDDLLLHHVEF